MTSFVDIRGQSVRVVTLSQKLFVDILISAIKYLSLRRCNLRFMMRMTQLRSP
jgi:hypothetical protein